MAVSSSFAFVHLYPLQITPANNKSPPIPAGHGFCDLHPCYSQSFINPAYPGFAEHRQPGYQFRNILGSEEFTPRFSSRRGIHSHQIFVGITESINIGILLVTQFQVRDSIKQFY